MNELINTERKLLLWCVFCSVYCCEQKRLALNPWGQAVCEDCRSMGECGSCDQWKPREDFAICENWRNCSQKICRRCVVKWRDKIFCRDCVRRSNDTL